jgi:hypothetical protein
VSGGGGRVGYSQVTFTVTPSAIVEVGAFLSKDSDEPWLRLRATDMEILIAPAVGETSFDALRGLAQAVLAAVDGLAGSDRAGRERVSFQAPWPPAAAGGVG